MIEKKISTLQEDVSIPEKTKPPLTAVDNMILRRDSMSITYLSRDSVLQSSESSRFLPSTLSDISNFISEHENKNTNGKTTQDLNLIHSYLVSHGEHRRIHEIHPDQLCDYLSGFLFAVHKKDGGEYEPTSLRGFLGSFERHLKNKNYVFFIINDDKFHKCRAVLKVKTKYIKSQGKGNTPHAAEAICG